MTWATSRALGGRDAARSTASPVATRGGRSPDDAAALVLFTSGTTGAPRGVVHSPGSLAATLEQAAALVELGPGDRVLGTGLHLVGPALLAGATVVLPPGRGGTDALARTTREARVTHVSLPLHRATAWAAAGGAERGAPRAAPRQRAGPERGPAARWLRACRASAWRRSTA